MPNFHGSEFAGGLTTHGRQGAALDLSSDVPVPVTAKGVVVTAAGNLKIRPAGETTGWITFEGVFPGFVPPYVVGVVASTANGTSASVATIAD